LIDAVFVPRGAEERAVRRALSRARSGVAVFTSGIGPQAVHKAAEAAAVAPLRQALATGLCGLLSPAFAVGDVLVYRDVRGPAAATLEFDRDLSDAVAARLANVQSGIHALASDHIVTRARDKRRLREQYGADAVDMETWAIAHRLRDAGVALAALRVGSDGPGDELPDLGRALTPAGDISALRLAQAFAGRPRASLTLMRNGMRALRALERAVFEIVCAA